MFLGGTIIVRLFVCSFLDPCPFPLDQKSPFVAIEVGLRPKAILGQSHMDDIDTRRHVKPWAHPQISSNLMAWSAIGSIAPKKQDSSHKLLYPIYPIYPITHTFPRCDRVKVHDRVIVVAIPKLWKWPPSPEATSNASPGRTGRFGGAFVAVCLDTLGICDITVENHRFLI